MMGGVGGMPGSSTSLGMPLGGAMGMFGAGGPGPISASFMPFLCQKPMRPHSDVNLHAAMGYGTFPSGPGIGNQGVFNQMGQYPTPTNGGGNPLHNSGPIYGFSTQSDSNSSFQHGGMMSRVNLTPSSQG